MYRPDSFIGREKNNFLKDDGCRKHCERVGNERVTHINNDVGVGVAGEVVCFTHLSLPPLHLSGVGGVGGAEVTQKNTHAKACAHTLAHCCL